MASCIALVVAAGRGTRLGARLPKQYLPVAGEPLLRHTLRSLASHPRIDGVRAVIHPDDGPHYTEAARGLDLLGIHPAAFEGHQPILAERDSVAAARGSFAAAAVHFAKFNSRRL